MKLRQFGFWLCFLVTVAVSVISFRHFAHELQSRAAPASEIPGINKGMSTAEVVAVLGAPDNIKTAGTAKVIWIYRDGKAGVTTVFFVNERVRNVTRPALVTL